MLHAWIHFSCAKHKRLWTCFLEVPQTCLRSSGEGSAIRTECREWCQDCLHKGRKVYYYHLLLFLSKKKTPHNRSLDLICLYPLKRRRGMGKIDSIPLFPTLKSQVVLLLRCHCSNFLKDIKRAPGAAVSSKFIWICEKNPKEFGFHRFFLTFPESKHCGVNSDLYFSFFLDISKQ